MQFKKLLCAALAAGTALSCTPPALALSGISSWAMVEVTAAQKVGLEPSSLSGAKAVAPIARAEFCEVALKLYETTSGKKAPKTEDTPFTDTSSTAVATAAKLGLVTGRGNGVFDPTGAINRQELCMILSNVLAASGHKASATDPEALAAFPDKGSVAPWASASVERMLGADILRGVSRTATDPTGEAATIVELKPTGTTTREQSLLLALRFTQTFPPVKAETPEQPGKPATPGGTDIPDPDGDAADKPAADADKPVGAPPAVPSTLPTTEAEKMAFVFGASGSFFATPTAAESSMTEISVPVWRLKDGKKIADKAHVTVNRNLAAIYTAIFIEIYNGSEQFPISDLGSYAWRSSPTSEHRWGTAIDLNYDANMEATINADGSMTPTCGTHWTPGEDPLSIPENGEVYNAFKKYGFAWGGNAWKSKRDYMHFSYFGR